MTSFKDLRDLQKAQRAGLIQVVSPDEQVKKAVEKAIGELAQVWFTKQEYAKSLIAAGAPDSEVMARAETLAAQDHKGRASACLALFSLHGGKVPDELRYIAHLVGAEIPPMPTQEKEEDATPAPKKASETLVNLHG